MPKEFNRIGLIGRQGLPSIDDSLQIAHGVLESQGCEVWVEDSTAQLLTDWNPNAVFRTHLSSCDLLVVVGGDGSILGVARDFAKTGTPVLGINRGGLGFLADVSPDQIEPRLKAVLSGNFRFESHFLLTCAVLRDGKQAHASTALNDVVVSAESIAKMIDLRLYINDEFVYEQRSDGLLISSPTGSTAYSLSAGGSIMHPSLDAIAVIPMFPHTLTARPIVVPGEFHLAVRVGEGDVKAIVSADSQIDFPLEPGDEVRVEKSSANLQLVHPTTHSFYEACRSKLDWATRLGRRWTE